MKLPPTVAKYFPNAEPLYAANMRADTLDIDQIAILVDNIEDAIEYLGKMYGWGPFYKAEHNGTAWYRGAMKDSRFYMAFCLVGEMEIELLQYIDGECAHKEGEPGLFHLRLLTPDMNADLQLNAANGAEVIWGAKNNGQFVGAYLEPNPLQFRAELLQRPEKT
jgi:hypothetical protein